MPEKVAKLGKGEIIIYKSRSGPKLEVRLEDETVWLSQKQMASLFKKSVTTINEHIKNIYKEKELNKKSTIRKFRIVQTEGRRRVEREIDFYNLDVIISVGYRVKSKRGTQFRIWATKVIREHLIKGFTINEKRLLSTRDRLRDFQEFANYLHNKYQSNLLLQEEKNFLELILEYSKTFKLLEEYDQGKLKLINKNREKFKIEYDIAKKIIEQIKQNLISKNEAGNLFGQEIDNRFEAIIGNIYQSFNGVDLYNSLEEKAAHLFYFIIKDHPFIDGNKRIASTLLIYFLEKNNFLYRKTGEKKFNDNTLISLSILTAISKPNEKDIIIKIITNLIED